MSQIFDELFKEQSPIYHPDVYVMAPSFRLSAADRSALRRLAGQVAEIAQRSEMAEKRKLWTDQNDLATVQPLIFADAEVGWNEIIPAETLECADPLARTWEMTLRKQIFWADSLKDDKVIEACFDVPYVFYDDGWGFEIIRAGMEEVAKGGAFRLEASLQDYDEDFEKLNFPQITIDWEKSNLIMELAQNTFGDLLAIRRQMSWHWDVSFVEKYVLLRGMEDFMCDFVAEPDYVHKTMRFMIDGMNKRLDWLEGNGLLTSNANGCYIGTGGQGFTNQLPQKDCTGILRTRDIWGSVQAQETVSINPDMYGEFILPYHKEIMERFGLGCYGCCEPFDPRWQYIKQIPHLRRVSVSPWADYSKVPEYLGTDYVAQVKLMPTPLASPTMNEDVVRKDCRHAVEVSKGGICEFIMKDNHTLGKSPNNIVRWVQIMREEIDRVYG